MPKMFRNLSNFLKTKSTAKVMNLVSSTAKVSKFREDPDSCKAN